MTRAATSNIREATEGDGLACAHIYDPYVCGTAISFETTPPSADQMSERIREAQGTHAWLVSEIEGEVIGYAYGHPFASRAAYRWSCETSIYLDRGHQGVGLGRALYEALLVRLAQRGYRNAFAGMALPNEASARLHRAVGFEQAGIYRHVGWKSNAWHDVAWLQKTLGPATEPPTELR